jgi:hypothetical protein
MVTAALEAAAARIRDQKRRAIEHGVLALVCAAAAAPLWLARPLLALAVAVGGTVELAISARAATARRSQIARLALEPDAYAIPEVARYGRRLTEPRQRYLLAKSIRTTVRDAHKPGSLTLTERVAAYARDLEALARLLASPRARVHPASIARCRRLLTEAAESPLYNPSLPKEEVAFHLHRIRSGIELE